MTERLSFIEDGAQLFPEVLDVSALVALAGLFAEAGSKQAGVRVASLGAVRHLADADGPIGGVAATALGLGCFPVRAILFDKRADANWSLGWHQDRTIAVKARNEAAGFGPWTMKQGMLHVSPPFAVTQDMVTLRVHLDGVDSDNAPLLIARGSHRYGRVPEAEIERVVDRSDIVACFAEPGDVWLYATPILHASDTSRSPRGRRVLQLDYARSSLPDGLEWAGV